MARQRIFYPSVGAFISNEYVPYSENTHSVEFDGANDFVDCGEFDAIEGATEITLIAWFKANTVSSIGSLISKHNSSNNRTFSFDLRADGSIRFVKFRASESASSDYVIESTNVTGLDDNQWHMAAVTWTGSDGATIYIDGVASASTSSVSGSGDGTDIQANNSNLYIGAVEKSSTTPDFLFEGKIDEVSIFTSSLSASQIAAIYNNGAPIDLASYSPLGWWRMGDNDGGVGTIITDQGSSGNDGELTNGPTFSTDAAGQYTYSGFRLTTDSSVSMSFSRQAIEQIGEEGVVDRVIVTQPEINGSFSFIQNEQFLNEKNMGLYVGSDKSIFGNHTSSTLDQKNLAFAIAPSGDFVELQYAEHYTGYDLINVGNAFLSSYSTSASVGQLGSTSVEYIGANLQYSVYGGSNKLPSINLISGDKSNTNTFTITDTGSRTTEFFKPSDITFSLTDTQLGNRISGANIQSFNLSISIPRNDLQGFGSMYSHNRPILFPAQGEISFSTTASEFNTGETHSLFSNDRDYSFDISLSTGGSPIIYRISKARLTAQGQGLGIGDNMSADFSFSFPITSRTGLSFIE